MTAKQIEAARKAITHYTKRQAKVWIRVFPDRPVTQKGLGVGMGHGKGDVKEFVVTVTPGRMIFEIGGVGDEIAREALRRAGHKMPFRTKIVSKDEQL
jgi:large subunit ribosomal protein L16